MPSKEPARFALEGLRVLTEENGQQRDFRTQVARDMLQRYLGQLAKTPDGLKGARLHYECARILEHPLGERAAAREHYLQAAKLGPDHLPSLEGARRFLQEEDRPQDVLRLLAAELRLATRAHHKAALYGERGRLLEAQGNLEEARAAFSAALELQPSDVVLQKSAERAARRAKDWDALEGLYRDAARFVEHDPKLRSALLAERARFWEVERADIAQATELYQRAFSEDPGSLSALHALKRLLYSQKRWADLVRALEREAQHSPDRRVRALAYYRMGRLYDDLLGDSASALSALNSAHRELPEDKLILTELARAYERSGKHEPLVGVLESLANLETGLGSRVVLFHRLGQICEEKLEQAEQAIDWYEKALNLDAAFVPALQALAKLYTRFGHWRRLIAMHLQEAARASDAPRAAAAHQRVGEIFELQLNEGERAMEHYAKALAVLPGHIASFKALSRLYAQEGKARELIELLERAIEWSTDTETRVAFLFRIGRLQEDVLHSCVAAVGAYRRVIELAPGHLGGIHAWQRAAERGGLWKELVVALQAEVTGTLDDKAKLPLLHRLGEIHELQLEDPEGALQFFEKATEIDRRYTPVLTNLGRLYYRLGRWKDLIATHERELATLPQSDVRATLLLKMAELHQLRLGDEASAVRCYSAALKEDAELEPARSALETIYRTRGQWEELAELLETRLAALQEKTARAEVAFRVGEVYENRLEKPERALWAYDQSTNADASFRPAQDARIRLLTQAGEWKRLIHELGREADAPGDASLAVAARLREAEVLRDAVGDHRKAVARFEQVVATDPACVPALLALERIYAEGANAPALAQTLDRQAQVFVEPSARIAALRQAARLTPDDNAACRARYLAILQLAPDDFDALKALEQLGTSQGDAELLALVDAAGSTAVQSEFVAVHRMRLAEALEAALDPRARQFYLAALELDPNSWAGTYGLVRLAEKSDEPSALIEAAERVARVTDDAETAARLLVRAFDRTRDKGVRPELLERALGLYPDCLAAAVRLRAEQLPAANADRLLDTLTQAAKSAGRPEVTAELWCFVAEIQADMCGDIAAGIAALGRAQERAPNNVTTMLRLAELYARNSQWLEATEQWARALSATEDKDILLDAHVRLATAAELQLKQPKRAYKHLDAALRLSPEHLPALWRLLDLQRAEGGQVAAEITAEKIVAASGPGEARASALVVLGDVRRALGKTQAAIEAFEQAIALRGVDSGGIEALAPLLEQQRPLEKQTSLRRVADALIRYIRDSGGDVAAYIELARVYGDALGEADEAVRTLEAGITAFPNEVMLRTELSVRLRLAGRLSEASQALKQLLDVDVFRAQTWRDLAEVYQGLQRHAEQMLALAALAAFGVATDLERATLASRAPRPHLRRASLDLNAMQSLALAGTEGSAANLLMTISESLARVHPPDFGRYRLAPQGRLGSRSAHPLRVVADYVAAVMGLGEYDLYVHRHSEHRLFADFTDPVALVVPERLLELDEPQQILVMARAMANVVRRVHALDHFSVSELELLLAAATRHFSPAFGAGLAEPAELDRYARQVHKALPWLGRGSVEDAAQRYASQPPSDLVAFEASMQHSALRLALVVSDALGPCLKLVREDPEILALPKTGNPDVVIADLMRFWLSDAALRLRHRLGSV